MGRSATGQSPLAATVLAALAMAVPCAPLTAQEETRERSGEVIGQVVDARTGTPLAGAFVNDLGEKEQMAIVSYHDSADLIQDFTSSKQLLFQALNQVKYGNNPRVLDALYAAIDGGFTSSAGRRIIVVLSAGIEGFSRVTEAEVLRLAREKGVSIFPVYVIGLLAIFGLGVDSLGAMSKP